MVATGVLAPRVLPESLSDGISNITLISEIMRFAFYSNFVGNPAIVVPAAYSQENLPISVQFMGRFWEEHTLLRLANLVEHNTSKQKPERHYSVLG